MPKENVEEIISEEVEKAESNISAQNYTNALMHLKAARLFTLDFPDPKNLRKKMEYMQGLIRSYRTMLNAYEKLQIETKEGEIGQLKKVVEAQKSVLEKAEEERDKAKDDLAEIIETLRETTIIEEYKEQSTPQQRLHQDLAEPLSRMFEIIGIPYFLPAQVTSRSALSTLLLDTESRLSELLKK